MGSIAVPSASQFLVGQVNEPGRHLWVEKTALKEIGSLPPARGARPPGQLDSEAEFAAA
jgi:hypothetical protein